MPELAQAPDLAPRDYTAAIDSGRLATAEHLRLVVPEIIDPGLTPVEIAVLTSISRGNTAAQAARELSMDKDSVMNSRRSLMAKFDTGSIAVATDQAIRRGIVPVETVPQTSVIETLTRADRGMLRLYARGITNHQVARTSEVSVESIEEYHDRLLKRLGAWSRPHAIRRAHELKILA